jgi:NADH-quinone oxidoreductase subunit M
MPDLSKREVAVIAPVLALLVVLGFYPKPALDMINPSVKQTMVQVHKQDPKPTIAEKGTRP